MTYLVEYAATERSSCHWLDCKAIAIGQGQLRIGKGSSHTVWYHVDCFFKFLVEVGPKNIKLKSWEDFWRNRGDPTEEDQQLLNEKIAQCLKDKANKKRKAEEDISDRYAKIAKLDLPPLFTDNLIELLCRFNTKDLLAAARVNKQFHAVSRKLLMTRAVFVSHKKFHYTTEKQLPFVMQLKKLKFKTGFCTTDDQNDKYTQLLAQLSNLQSLNITNPLKFIFPALKQLTQLTELNIHDGRLYNEAPIAVSFDMFKELKKLSLTDLSTPLTTELVPLSGQLTYLSLHMVNINSVRTLTNLEHLTLSTNYGGDIGARYEKIIETEAFDLPRLTSFETNRATDLTKWTRLKALKFIGGYAHSQVNVGLPPNLEQLTTRSLHLPEVLPATLKYLNIGTIQEYMRGYSDVVGLYKSLRTLGDHCVVELYCDFVVLPEDILKRDKLTLVVTSKGYGNLVWDSMAKFFNGTMPQRLHVIFTNWKNCRYKPKLLDLLKSAESKTRLLLDFK